LDLTTECFKYKKPNHLRAARPILHPRGNPAVSHEIRWLSDPASRQVWLYHGLFSYNNLFVWKKLEFFNRHYFDHILININILVWPDKLYAAVQ